LEAPRLVRVVNLSVVGLPAVRVTVKNKETDYEKNFSTRKKQPKQLGQTT
jgi:hypothetical protein